MKFLFMLTHHKVKKKLKKENNNTITTRDKKYIVQPKLKPNSGHFIFKWCPSHTENKKKQARLQYLPSLQCCSLQEFNSTTRCPHSSGLKNAQHDSTPKSEEVQ